MERPAKRAFVLAAAVVLAMLIAGCGEQNSANVKKHRLIAAENIQLKKALEQSEKELEKCLQEKKSLEERLQASIQYLSRTHMEESQKLREENQSLKSQTKMLQAQIAQLKKQLKELRERPTIPGGPQPL